jgi:hypothetical protein
MDSAGIARRGGNPPQRQRAPIPHEHEEYVSLDVLTLHLKKDHGYFESDLSSLSVELRHTPLDIALGILDSAAWDERLTATERARFKNDYDEMLFEHVREDHLRDHD